MSSYGKIYLKDANGQVRQFVPEAYIGTTEYEGATASAAGVSGLVPPAAAGQQNNVLRGDGSWHNVAFDRAVELSGSTPSANLLESSYFIYNGTSGSGTVTFTFTYPSSLSPLDSTSFMLLMKTSGSKTIQWPSSVKWTNGMPPLLSTDGAELLTFTTLDGGASWYGSTASFGA